MVNPWSPRPPPAACFKHTSTTERAQTHPRTVVPNTRKELLDVHANIFRCRKFVTWRYDVGTCPSDCPGPCSSDPDRWISSARDPSILARIASSEKSKRKRVGSPPLASKTGISICQIVSAMIRNSWPGVQKATQNLIPKQASQDGSGVWTP